MSRILVALDDSCGSEKALEAAVKLAQQDGGFLTAVTVLEQTGNPALDQTHGGCQDPNQGRPGGVVENRGQLRPLAGRAVVPGPSRRPPSGNDHPLR